VPRCNLGEVAEEQATPGVLKSIMALTPLARAYRPRPYLGKAFRTCHRRSASCASCPDTGSNRSITYLRGKSILITGGTGAFGRAFVGWALDRLEPRRIVGSRETPEQ